MLDLIFRTLLVCIITQLCSANADSLSRNNNYDEFIRLRESIAAELQRIRYRVARTSELDVPFLRDVDFKLSKVLGGGNSGGDGQKIIEIPSLYFEGSFAFGTSNSSKMQAKRAYEDLLEDTEDDLRRQIGNRLLSFEPGLPRESVEDGNIRYVSNNTRIVLRKNQNERVHTISVRLMGERSFGTSNADQRIAWGSFEKVVEEWVKENQRRLNQRFLLSAGFGPSLQSGGDSAFQYERELFIKFLLNPGEDLYEKHEWIQGQEVSGHSNASFRIAYQRYFREYEDWVRDQGAAGSPLLFAGPGNMELQVGNSGVSYRSKATALLLLK